LIFEYPEIVPVVAINVNHRSDDDDPGRGLLTAHQDPSSAQKIPPPKKVRKPKCCVFATPNSAAVQVGPPDFSLVLSEVVYDKVHAS
jgi:hypothetical protein